MQGFAERKLMLMSDVIAYCKSFHNAAVRRARLAAASGPSKVQLITHICIASSHPCQYLLCSDNGVSKAVMQDAG